MYENILSEMMDFIDKSKTPFHAISLMRKELTQNGYSELFEGSKWDLKEKGKYFVVRNESSLIAFDMTTVDFRGFQIAATHTDSPTFKVKGDNPELSSSNSYIRLNTEKYGGMICSAWLDRPLSVAGRLIVKNKNTIETVLIDVDRDLLLIPNLAIHMNRNMNEGQAFNPQVDMIPLLAQSESNKKLLNIVAESADIDEQKVIGSDLFLYSRQKPTVWGADNEFFSASRIDNLECTYAVMRGFIEADNMVDSIPLFVAFDSEEVGSTTKSGADSTFLTDVIERICDSCGKETEERKAMLSSSFMVSADNAHAIHPNHPEKSDEISSPIMNKGIVIKMNANQKYTTDAVSYAFFKEVCRRSEVPYQEFANRSDMPGGSTLGNISTAHLSINSVDIGLAQLAMHSPFETAGTKDVKYMADAIKTFFEMRISDMGMGKFEIL